MKRTRSFYVFLPHLSKFRRNAVTPEILAHDASPLTGCAFRGVLSLAMHAYVRRHAATKAIDSVLKCSEHAVNIYLDPHSVVLVERVDFLFRGPERGEDFFGFTLARPVGLRRFGNGKTIIVPKSVSTGIQPYLSNSLSDRFCR